MAETFDNLKFCSNLEKPRNSISPMEFICPQNQIKIFFQSFQLKGAIFRPITVFLTTLHNVVNFAVKERTRKKGTYCYVPHAKMST